MNTYTARGERKSSPGVVPVVTALPSGPYDGQEVYYQADAAGTYGGPYLWHFRYDQAAAAWLPVGRQNPLFREVVANESTGNTTFSALTTSGPSVALPLSGDWDIEIGCHQYCTTLNTSSMSYDIGATAASDNDAIARSQANAGVDDGPDSHRIRRKTGLTPVTLTAKYRISGGGSAYFAKRTMRAWPVKVTG